MDTALDEHVRALREHRAFVRPDARTISVWGADAERWLDDLVTAGVEGLPEGGSVRSLLLTPTGRIRADFHVLRDEGRFLLAQGRDQPERIDAMLAPYVLSSAVELAETTAAPMLLPADGGWRLVRSAPPGSTEAGAAAAEAWRVDTGIATFPVDLDPDSLPAEAGLDVPPVTDTQKGCFLGQESVARVRNLGHPTRVVRAFAADVQVTAGEVVRSGDADAGIVTSTAPAAAGGTAVIARIRWDARDHELRTRGGTPLRPR
jgi:folate-binding protein YgfZ